MSHPSSNRNTLIRQAGKQPSISLTDQARAQAIRNVAREVRRVIQEQNLRAEIAGGSYRPRMDLYDDAELPNIYAMLELPGITPDNVNVQVYPGKLVVTGCRGSPLLDQLHKDKILGGHNQRASRTSFSSFQRKELKWGQFHREIAIPEHCSREHIDAEMKDGMLTLRWPRATAISA